MKVVKQAKKNDDVLTNTKSCRFPFESGYISEPEETNPNSEDENLQKTLLLENFPFDLGVDDQEGDITERVPYSLVHKFVNLIWRSGQSANSKVETEP